MNKTIKRTLSSLLACALVSGASVGCISASAVTATPLDTEYINTSTWGTSSFTEATADGANGTLKADPNLYSVINRTADIGASCKGMTGYVVCQMTEVQMKKDHVYNYEIRLYVDDILEADREKPLLFGDCYHHTADVTDFTNPLYMSDFEAVSETNYDPDYGYRYKVVNLQLTSTVDNNDSEIRLYYNHTTGSDEPSYGVGIINCYKVNVYDTGVGGTDAKTLVQTLNCGSDGVMVSSEAWGTNPGMTEDEIDMIDTIQLGKGLYVSKGKVADCNNTFLIGNISKELKAGNYCFTTTVTPQYYDEGELFTIKILKDGSDFKSYTGSTSDIDENGTINPSIPFTAEDGTYTAEVYINNRAGLLFRDFSLDVEVVQADINAADDAIKAAPEIKDTFSATDVDPLNTYISTVDGLIDGLKAKYGEGITAKIPSFTDYSATRSSFQSFIQLVATRNEDAQAVDELITAITDKNDAAGIETAKLAIEDFVTRYTEDAKVLITKYAQYNALTNGAYGDLDGNGTVDSSDALVALQIAVGKVEATETMKTLGDVDANGTVDSADALAILQKTVGKLDKFKVETVA